MVKINLEEIANGLSDERPLFHSEADFQHALAWRVQTLYPQAKIRLERRIPGLNYQMDIYITYEEQEIPVEVKYPTHKLQYVLDGEEYNLLNGAADIAQYDFIKDIMRVEQTVLQNNCPYGYAILLTNEKYIRKKGTGKTINAEFALYDERVLSGTMDWAAHTGAGSKKKREQPLTLRGSYELFWNDYYHIKLPAQYSQRDFWDHIMELRSGYAFWYLCVRVDREKIVGR